MAFKYDPDSPRDAHIRIDMIEEHSIHQDKRHDQTEKTVESLLKTLVENDQRKENDNKWYRRILIGSMILFIVYKVGVVEALKLWVGLI